jgi:hypothetical protein
LTDVRVVGHLVGEASASRLLVEASGVRRQRIKKLVVGSSAFLAE